jgi:hypothetical protein
VCLLRRAGDEAVRNWLFEKIAGLFRLVTIKCFVFMFSDEMNSNKRFTSLALERKDNPSRSTVFLKTIMKKNTLIHTEKQC